MRATAPLIALALAVPALAACPPPTPWHKEGVGTAEVDRVRALCTDEARGYLFLEGPERSVTMPTPTGDIYSAVAVESARREADVFGACMRAHGFARAAGEP